MQKKFILHSDFNGFFAAVECKLHPEIANLPVAVVGDPEKRHGIVLAKNNLAKKFDITTGETIWSALKKCPELYLIQPHFDEYLNYSQQAFKLYNSHSPYVEPFGLDECWLDITAPDMNFEQARQYAENLREEVKETIGITVSIGVSFTKSFAKLASDLKKPDAVTVITDTNYKQIVWPLPCEDLLYVGKATKAKLNSHGMFKIGDIANAPKELLVSMLGKAGNMLYNYANGLDYSQVAPAADSTVAKSIGNSTTLDHDLHSYDEVSNVFYALADKVSGRLRKSFAKCTVVQISVKDTNLITSDKQTKLSLSTDITNEIAEAAISLYKAHYNPKIVPVRALGIHTSGLVYANEPYQIGFFDDSKKREKQAAVDLATDSLRERFGYSILSRASSIEHSSKEDTHCFLKHHEIDDEVK